MMTEQGREENMFNQRKKKRYGLAVSSLEVTQ